MNIVASMLENWSDAVASYETALGSAGSATEEFSRYQESMEYRINQFKNAVIGFWQEAINTDGVKDFIDTGTAFMGVMTDAVKVTGLFPPVIFAVSFALMGLNKELRTATINIGTAKTGTNLLTRSMQGLGVAAGTVGKFFKGFIIPTLALTAVSMLAFELVKIIIDLKNATEMAKESLANLNSEITDGEKEIDNIKKLRDEYEELSGVIYKTEEQKERFRNIQEQLANQFPELIKGYDSEGNAILANTKEVEELISQKERLLELNKETFIIEFETKGNSLQEETKKQKKDLDELHEKREKLINQYETLKQADIKNNNVIGRQKELEKLSDKISNTTTEINDLTKTISENISQNNKWAVTVLELDDNFNNLGNSINNDVINAAQKLDSIKLTDFTSKIKDTDLPKYLEEIEKAINDFNNKLISDDQFAESYRRNFEEIEKIIAYTFDVSIDEARNFTDSFKNSLFEQEKVHKDVFGTMLDNSNAFYQAMVLSNNDLVKKFADNYGIDLRNFNNLAQAKLSIELDMYKKMASAAAKYYSATTGTTTDYFKKITTNPSTVGQVLESQTAKHMIDIAKDAQDKHSKALKELNSLAGQFSDSVIKPDVNFQSPGGSPSSKSGSGSSKKDKEFEKAFDLREEKIKSINHQLSLLQDQLEEVKSIEEKAEIYDKMILLYREKEKELRSVWQHYNDELYNTRELIKEYVKAGVITQQQFDDIINGNATSKDLIIKDESLAKLLDLEREYNDKRNATQLEIRSLDNQTRELIKQLIDTYKQERIDKLNRVFEEMALGIQPLNNELELLKIKLDLLPTSAISQRMDVIAEQFKSTKNRVGELRNQLSDLSQISPKTAEEANMLADQMSNLASQIRQGHLEAVQMQIQLDKLRFEEISKPFEYANKALERELNLIQHNLSMLEGGLLSGFDLDLAIDFAMPVMPEVESAIEKTIRKNEEMLAEQKRYEEEILAIKKQAFELQLEEQKKFNEEIVKELVNHYKEATKAIVEELGIKIDTEEKLEAEHQESTEEQKKEHYAKVLQDAIDEYFNPELNETETHQNAMLTTTHGYLSDIKNVYVNTWADIISEVRSAVSEIMSQVEKARSAIASLSKSKTTVTKSGGGSTTKSYAKGTDSHSGGNALVNY